MPLRVNQAPVTASIQGSVRLNKSTGTPAAGKMQPLAAAGSIVANCDMRVAGFNVNAQRRTIQDDGYIVCSVFPQTAGYFFSSVHVRPMIDRCNVPGSQPKCSSWSQVAASPSRNGYVVFGGGNSKNVYATHSCTHSPDGKLRSFRMGAKGFGVLQTPYGPINVYAAASGDGADQTPVRGSWRTLFCY